MNNLISNMKDAIFYFKPMKKQYEELLSKYKKYSKSLTFVYTHFCLNKLVIVLILIVYAKFAFVQVVTKLSHLYDSKQPVKKVVDVAATTIRRKNNMLDMDINKFLFVYSITIFILGVIWLIFYLVEIPLKKLLLNAILTVQENSVRKTAEGLYNYYDGFYYKYGYVCPLKSFQYCHPDEIENIYKILVSGIADDIPSAKAILKKENRLKNYSFLDMWNKNDYNFKDQSIKSKKENNMEFKKDKFNNTTYKDNKTYSSKSEEEKANSDRYTDNNKHGSILEEKIAKSTHFRGIKTEEELKKRYHGLLKTYHTDSGIGDNETAQEINIEYRELKKCFIS